MIDCNDNLTVHKIWLAKLAWVHIRWKFEIRCTGIRCIVKHLGKLAHWKDLDETWRICNIYFLTSIMFHGCFVAGRISVNQKKIHVRAPRLVLYDENASYGGLLAWGRFLSLSVYRIWCLGIEICVCLHDLMPPSYSDSNFQTVLSETWP